MAGTVWKGHLSFGLISIPVRLTRAARAERIPLRQFARVSPAAAPAETQPPGRAAKVVAFPAAPAEETPVIERVRHDTPQDLLKGYEYGKDQWVLLDKEDLKQIAPKTSQSIDIREFVRFAEIDPVYLENSYYMAAEKSGEKAYALLYQALRDTGYAALCDIAMHRRQHVLIARPGTRGIIAHTMYYADEVRREEEPRADLSLVSASELELAKAFVQALAGKFEPEKYKDAYRERLNALIEAKARGEGVTTAAAPEQPKTADLMDALQRSLAAVGRKPPGSIGPPDRGVRRGRGRPPH